MLSRVADSLYWMSRYLERAEHSARVIGVNLNLMLETSAHSEEHAWGRLITRLGFKTQPESTMAGALAHTLVLHPDNRSSVVSCIVTARENARQVREQISSEMWEQLNRLFHGVKRADVSSDWQTDPLEFLKGVIDHIHLFHGITDSIMAHGPGWQFIQVGRYLERAVGLSTLLDAHFREFRFAADGSIDADDYLLWIGLLKSCTAFEAFCKVYTADLRADRVAEFLLLNAEFPHAVRFAADKIHESLEALPEAAWTKKSGRVTRLSGRLKAQLSFSQVEEVMARGMGPYLESINNQCAQIHSAIYQVYIHYPIESAVEA
jgi:uncharacterized alpha-E superfamily protein